MKRVPELAPLELVEMFVTVFCFLKDSSEVSSVLMDDFRQAQGYLFLSDFLLRLETENSKEAHEAVRNLVLMITSLCMCGYIELKPSQASSGSLFQMPGFVLPQPSGRGTSVRNIQAFHVNNITSYGMQRLHYLILGVTKYVYKIDLTYTLQYYLRRHIKYLSFRQRKLFHFGKPEHSKSIY